MGPISNNAESHLTSLTPSFSKSYKLYLPRTKLKLFMPNHSAEPLHFPHHFPYCPYPSSPSSSMIIRPTALKRDGIPVNITTITRTKSSTHCRKIRRWSKKSIQKLLLFLSPSPLSSSPSFEKFCVFFFKRENSPSSLAYRISLSTPASNINHLLAPRTR